MSVFLFGSIPESLRSYAEFWNSKTSSDVLVGISERLPGLDLALAIHSSNVANRNPKVEATKCIVHERLGKMEVLFMVSMVKNLPSKRERDMFLDCAKSYEELKYRATEEGIEIPSFENA